MQNPQRLNYDVAPPIQPKLLGRINADSETLARLRHLDALTVDQFCLLHNISNATYYKLRKEGRAPAVMHLGAKVLISREDAAAWRAERANPTGNDAQAVEEQKAKLAARSKTAVAAALNSPNHIAVRRRAARVA